MFKTPILPPPGLYPELPRVDCVPDNKWRVIVVSPIVQVTPDGLLLACADEFKSDLTTCWGEGVWTTGSLVHDCTGCTGAGWRLNQQTGQLDHVRVSRNAWDRAWRQAHLTKRFTQSATPTQARIQWFGLHMASWIPWNKYRRNQQTDKHRWEVAAITLRCERAVWMLLTEGVSAIEDVDGRPAQKHSDYSHGRGFTLSPTPSPGNAESPTR